MAKAVDPINEFCDLEDEFQSCIANMQGPDVSDGIVIRKAMILIMNSDDDGTAEQRVLMDGFSRWMFPQTDEERANRRFYAMTVLGLYEDRYETETGESPSPVEQEA